MLCENGIAMGRVRLTHGPGLASAPSELQSNGLKVRMSVVTQRYGESVQVLDPHKTPLLVT